jgi:hypothetical protein
MTLDSYYRAIKTLLFTVAMITAPLGLMADPAEKAAQNAAKLSPAQLLPDTTALYLNITHPDQLADFLIEHPISLKLQGLDQYKQALNNPQAAQMLAVLALLEGQVNMKWPAALKAATGHGMVVAFDPATQGAVLMIKAKDPQVLIKIRDGVFNIIRTLSGVAGGNDPIKTNEYRGVTAYPLGQGNGLAIVGPMLIATNNGDLGKLVIDNLIDAPSTGTLATHKQFIKAGKEAKGKSDPTGWAYIRLDVLRDAGIASEVFNKKIDNPLLEALVGPIQSGIQQAPYAVATLDANAKGITLKASVSYDQSKIAQARHYAFASSGGGAPIPLKPAGTIGTIVAYRDIAALWQAKDILFSEQTAAGMDQGDSQFSTVLGGRSFSGEFLTQMKPNVQIIVVKQDYKAAKVPTPPVQIPAAAYVFQARNPQIMQDQVALAMQALLTITNSEAKGMRPSMIQREVERANATYVTTRYANMTTDKSKKGQMYHNFTPTVAFWKDYVLVCSTRPLAEQLVKELEAKGPSKISSDVNARLEISGKASAELIQANFDMLAVQNTLEKGQTIEQARAEWKLLTQLVGMIDSTHLGFNDDGKRMSLEWTINAPMSKSTSGSSK